MSNGYQAPYGQQNNGMYMNQGNPPPMQYQYTQNLYGQQQPNAQSIPVQQRMPNNTPMQMNYQQPYQQPSNQGMSNMNQQPMTQMQPPNPGFNQMNQPQQYYPQPQVQQPQMTMQPQMPPPNNMNRQPQMPPPAQMNYQPQNQGQMMSSPPQPPMGQMTQMMPPPSLSRQPPMPMNYGNQMGQPQGQSGMPGPNDMYYNPNMPPPPNMRSSNMMNANGQMPRSKPPLPMGPPDQTMGFDRQMMHSPSNRNLGDYRQMNHGYGSNSRMLPRNGSYREFDEMSGPSDHQSRHPKSPPPLPRNNSLTRKMGGKKQTQLSGPKKSAGNGGVMSTLFRKKKKGSTKQQSSRNLPRAGSMNQVDMRKVDQIREERPARAKPRYQPEAFDHMDRLVQEKRNDMLGALRKKAWTVQWSQDFGKPYYFNHFTGESLWDPPHELLE